MIASVMGIAAVAVLSAGTAEAKTFKGKWESGSPATLQFLENKRVLYCFRQDCTITDYHGDKDDVFHFHWDHGMFRFERTDDGYAGQYRHGGNASTATFK